MKAIILAAGKGSRLGVLTADAPKPMIEIGGQPLLAHLIGFLPAIVDEVILAVGYHGEQVKKYFGERYGGRKISYVDASDLTGTAGALFKAREMAVGRFLVLNGDDIFHPDDIENLIAYPLAMGVFEGAPVRPGYVHIDIDEGGNLKAFRKPGHEEVVSGMRGGAGAFVLNEEIFRYEPVPLSSGEYSLPHTVLKFAKDHQVAIVPMPSWRGITYPEDVSKMADYLASIEHRG